MGYTHYWERPTELPTKKWEEFVQEVRALYHHNQDLLAEEYNTPTKPPVANPYRVKFNGIEGEGHETFFLARLYDPYEGQRVSEDGRHFAFCKTACKPYDSVVIRVLALAEKIFGPDIVSVSSDGDWDEIKRELNTQPQPKEPKMETTTTTATKPTTETYKGHVLLVLNPDAKFPIKFGLKKAKFLIENLDEIQNFIEEQEAA
jgi:hypothetical protein